MLVGSDSPSERVASARSLRMISPARTACPVISRKASADFGNIRIGSGEEAITGLGVIGDCGQGLIQLVRDARSHLSHCGQARHLPQAFLKSTGLFLGAAAHRDVLDKSDKADRIAARDHTNRQECGKGTAVFASRCHLAAASDDLWDSRLKICLR